MPAAITNAANLSLRGWKSDSEVLGALLTVAHPGSVTEVEADDMEGMRSVRLRDGTAADVCREINPLSWL